MSLPRKTTIADEDLLALADGELPPERSAELRRLLAADPEAAARFADFVESRALAHALLSEEGAAGDRSGVLPHHSRARSPQPSSWRSRAGARILLAAAAGLFMGVPLGVAVMGLAPGAGDRQQAVRDSDLQWVLSTLASGQTATLPGGQATVLATHRTGSDVLCREVLISEGPEGQVLPTATFVACRRGASWSVIAAFPERRADGYAPASGADLADGLLRSLGSVGALAGTEEAAALRRP